MVTAAQDLKGWGTNLVDNLVRSQPKLHGPGTLVQIDTQPKNIRNQILLTGRLTNQTTPIVSNSLAGLIPQQSCMYGKPRQSSLQAKDEPLA